MSIRAKRSDKAPAEQGRIIAELYVSERNSNRGLLALAIARAIRGERARCVAIAAERRTVCMKAAELYAESHPKDPYYAASERCAALEARYIAEKIAGDEPAEPDHALKEAARPALDPRREG